MKSLKFLRIINLMRFIHVCIILLGLCRIVNGHFNLYMNETETKRLLGIPGELFYVQNGVVNSYALSFSIPLNTNTSDVFFNWFNTQQPPHDSRLSIDHSFSVSDPEAIIVPSLDIPRDGHLPTVPSVFRITLKCSGSQTAEVDVKIYFNVSVVSSGNVTSLEVRRKKTCIRQGGVADEGDYGNNYDGREFRDSLSIRPSTDSVLDIHSVFDPNSGSIFYISVGSIVAIVFVITLAMCVCCIRSRNSRRQPYRLEKSGDGTSGFSHERSLLRSDTPNRSNNSAVCSGASSSRRVATPLIPPTVPMIDVMQLKSSEVRSSLAEISVDRNLVCLTDILLQGAFGRVYQGMLLVDGLRKQYVIIKTVTGEARRDQVDRMLRESLITKGLRHENICSIRAACVEGSDRDSIHQSAVSESLYRCQSQARDTTSLRQSQYLYQLQPLLIYPSSPDECNLKIFLLKCLSTDIGLHQVLNTQQLVHMAVQIARAVYYLHQHGIIHKDVATRNCLVNESLTIRLCDSSLSRDLFPHDYHCLGDNENRPIKWLPPEALCDRLFSFSSDAWAVGVTLWELMTLGQQPYCQIDPFEMSAYLLSGYRLPQPVNCPNELYEMMCCCWVMECEERPNLSQLLMCLQDFFAALSRYV